MRVLNTNKVMAPVALAKIEQPEKAKAKARPNTVPGIQRGRRAVAEKSFVRAGGMFLTRRVR